MLLLAGIAGVCGWVARGVVATPEATAQPRPASVVVTAPPIVQVMRAPAAAPPTMAEEPEDVEDEEVEDAGEDIGAVIARAEQQAVGHNSVYGIVTDDRTGEVLAGVTVIVSGRAMEGTQTAITDEHGYYKITNLPSGYVLATFYYADYSSERDNVVVSSLDPTPLFQRIDQSAQPAEVQMVDEYIQGIEIDTDYIKNIPVPGRTFESVLGVAAGSSGDTLGVSFSSRCGVENTYVIE